MRQRRNKIARLRRKLGMRQLDLARKIDVFQSEISKVERGEREPGVYLARRIARALRSRIEDVF